MKEEWILSISNRDGKDRKICVGSFGDGSKEMTLVFEKKSPNVGHKFSSSKQAWWHWYQFRKHHPELCQGYFAEVRLNQKMERRPDL